jgi:hypothetical protein
VTDGEGARSGGAAPAPAPKPAFQLGGYVEAFYQWNFNRPGNGLTNFRGFDNRHNAFTLANAALDALWDQDRLLGRLTLQVGHTPSTYYLAEPAQSGAASVNGSDKELWKYIQQAYTGYRFGSGKGLVVAAGVFLSPIGIESMAIRDNWNWSRSNLFFGLPFYHTGVKVTYPLSDAWSLTLAGYNGWNSVVDNNGEKSVSAQALYTTPRLIVSGLYFGGVERSPGAAEGRAWRHLLDAHVTWNASPKVSLAAHLNGGVERNEVGTARWGAGALYARLRVAEPLFLVLRGDAFLEHTPAKGETVGGAIFWPVPWVSSGTATLDLRPHERASFRLEFRHDQAGGALFFSRSLRGDAAGLPSPTRRSQDTLTAGITTWF